MTWFSEAKNRAWVYRVCLAAVPLLVLVGLVSETAAPLVVALVGAILAPSMALQHMTPDVPLGNSDIADAPEEEIVNG
jgi:hypothetical protein